MTYFDIINQAIELCISIDSKTGLAYLEPPYRMLLRESGLLNEDIVASDELYELLKLEVEKINAQVNHTHAVAEWMYNIICEVVEPTAIQEENELMKNLVEYLKAKTNTLTSSEDSTAETENDNEQ